MRKASSSSSVGVLMSLSGTVLLLLFLQLLLFTFERDCKFDGSVVGGIVGQHVRAAQALAAEQDAVGGERDAEGAGAPVADVACGLAGERTGDGGHELLVSDC